MTLANKIKLLYPQLQDIDFLNLIKLQNDGDEKGDYIKEWNHLVFQRPTENQINSIGE